MNTIRFLRWHFRGTSTNPSFWGIMISLAAFVALLADCPQPWPIIMSMFGMIMIIMDLLISYFRDSYREWRLEQQQAVDTLKKEQL